MNRSAAARPLLSSLESADPYVFSRGCKRSRMADVTVCRQLRERQHQRCPFLRREAGTKKNSWLLLAFPPPSPSSDKKRRTLLREPPLTRQVRVRRPGAVER